MTGVQSLSSHYSGVGRVSRAEDSVATPDHLSELFVIILFLSDAPAHDTHSKEKKKKGKEFIK